MINTLKTIRQIELQLTQMQLAALLGMGVATITRYENGTTPTPAHFELLKGLEDPTTLVRLLQGKEKILGSETYKRVMSYAQENLKQLTLRQFSTLVSEKSKHKPFKGMSLNVERLKQLIIFFTQHGEWKTKLNKLLFYADFWSCKQLSKPLTGMTYVVGHYGPIPDHHEQLYAALIECNVLKTREEFIRTTGEPVEKLISILDFNRNLFTKRELSIIEQVYQFFKEMNAKEIADYSHNEKAYTDTALGSTISYTHANSLRDIIEKDIPITLPSLNEIASSLTSSIPNSEYKNLPKDGARNLDHYLYGQKSR